MAAQTTKAPLGLGGILRTHAADPPQQRTDFTDLPGGVQGVAELVEAKLGVYNKSQGNDKAGRTGKRFLYLAGTVIEPVSVQDRKPFWNPQGGPGGRGGAIDYGPPAEVRTRGLRTSLTLPLCATVGGGDTPKAKTEEENVSAALNELKLLGGPECCNSLAALPANASEAQCWGAVEAILAALKAARIRFRFTTRYGRPSAQYPEPMVFENWQGTEGVGPPSSANGQAVQDNTGGPAPTGGGAAVDAGAAEDPSSQAAGADQLTEAEMDDLPALFEAARDDNNPKQAAAQARIHEHCEAAGMDPDWYTADDTTWDEIEAALNTPQTEDGPPAPAPKEVYGLVLAKGKKPVKVTIKAVDEAAQTVDVLTPDKKVKKGVAWADLIRE